MEGNIKDITVVNGLKTIYLQKGKVCKYVESL